ncbi:MAG: heme exporter protein CcmD [Acidobacteriota bacterium]|nr:heme exporter protein CcmD [Acidobacteriota bacterium]
MNWSDFFAQGGYALYVWGSYLTALVLLGGEALLVISCNRKHSKLRSQSSKTGSGTKHETSS